MKKFLKKIFLFSLPIILLLVACEVLLRNIPNDYSYKNKYLNEHSNEIEILVLGSSHAYSGINPEYFKEKTFNASYVSQSLEYDYRIIKKYKDSFRNLKCIVLPIDYFSLFSRMEDGIEKWRVKDYIIYYEMAIKSKISEKFEITNNKLKANQDRFFKYYKNGQSDISCNSLGWGAAYNSKVKKDVELTGKTAAQRHTIANKLAPLKLNTDLINRIINFSKKRGIKILFLTTPAYCSYSRNIDQVQLNMAVNIAEDFTRRNSNVSYINLLADKSFTLNDFYDGDHLNEIGAKKLSLKIDSIINTISVNTIRKSK